jgi:hypothetical protein
MIVLLLQDSARRSPLSVMRLIVMFIQSAAIIKS